jgi:hypothetical protein
MTLQVLDVDDHIFALGTLKVIDFALVCLLFRQFPLFTFLSCPIEQFIARHQLVINYGMHFSMKYFHIYIYNQLIYFIKFKNNKFNKFAISIIMRRINNSHFFA